MVREESGEGVLAERRWGGILAPVVLVVLALGLRVLFTYQVHTSSFSDLCRAEDLVDDGSGALVQKRDDGTDMEKHDAIARWILQNGWFEKSADVSPLYAYAVLPLSYVVTGSSIFRTKMIQAGLDSVTVVLVYLLALRLYGRRAAIYAGLMAAMYAPFIIYQGQLLGEFMVNLVVVGLFLVLVGFDGRMGWKRAVVTGALFGLAMLAKPTVLVLVPLGLVWVWLRLSRRFLATVAATAIMAASALAVILPFSYRNYRGIGEFHLVRGNGGKMLYMGNNPSATGGYGEPRTDEARKLAEATAGDDMPLSEKDRIYTKAALGFMRKNPGRFARLLWRKFGMFFGAEEVANNLSVRLYRRATYLRHWVFPGFAFVLPLAAAGVAFSLRKSGVWFVTAQAAVYSAVIILFVVVGRYRLPVVALVLPAAGFAISEMIQAVKNRKFAQMAGLAVVAVAVAVPVNCEPLRVLVKQRLHPSGLVSTRGNVVTIRDDSDYSTPYGAWLQPEDVADQVVAKHLIVTKIPPDLEKVTAAIQLFIVRGGQLEVSLNDFSRTVDVEHTPKRWLRVAFPADALRRGSNAVYVRGLGGIQARISADDRFNFGRSQYAIGPSALSSDFLDITSYREQPSLHLGGHEFKIRLMLHSKAPQPAQPAGGR